MTAGAMQYLTKPFSPCELLGLVANALSPQSAAVKACMGPTATTGATAA
jgi:DNA-binding response OmpR family regulator